MYASTPKTAAEIVDEIGIITTECAKEFKIPAESRKELEATIDKTTFDASDDFKVYILAFKNQTSCRLLLIVYISIDLVL